MECNGKARFAGFAFLAAGQKLRLAEPEATPGEKDATRRTKGWRRAGRIT
jgi:hypothetical protein